MRFKQRYLLFRVVGKDAELTNEKEVRNFIFSYLLSFFGQEGFARLAFKLISYNPYKKEGILRCERSNLGRLIGAFAISGRIGEQEARIECLSSSGTLKSLQTK
ncbi:MAG: Rpp14/Pop5 family protein [Candidatus Anstonellales archaeon]